MPSSKRVRSLQVVGALTAIATVAAVSSSTASAAEPTAPFLSEIHYDNVGADTGEALEIEAPVGFDLSGWQLALYNGNGGAVYNTRTLSGTVPAAGVVVATYPTDGIQNGSPDAVALVRPDGTVAEFLSYEGPLTATGGPANGTTAPDIGVSEATSTPVGFSLQKIGGTWQAPAANTFGTRNSGGDPDPDPDPDPVGCDLAVTRTIAEVQGTTDASPLSGSSVVIEGVVTANHSTGGYNGVYVQTAGSGGRAPSAGTPSDGVFVYLTTNAANHPDVAVGDSVRVRGVVSEFSGLTEVSIGAKADFQVCAHDATLPAPVALSLPLDPAARESAESMLVAPAGDFTVSEVYNTNRFGEVVLAAGDEAATIPTDFAGRMSLSIRSPTYAISPMGSPSCPPMRLKKAGSGLAAPNVAEDATNASGTPNPRRITSVSLG
jgi:5'-nucleotidase